MAYGKIKADTLVYDNSGSDTEVTISSLGSKASLPASAGTVGASEVVQVDANKDTTGIRNLTISGNLQVNGTTTTVASSTMTVSDKNIELAKGAANDAAADGGGITLESGDGNKEIKWVNSTDAWTFNQDIEVTTGDITIKAGEGNNSTFHMFADEGDDNADKWRLESNVSGEFKIQQYSTGSWATPFTLNVSNNATFAGSVTDSKGELRNIPRNNQTSAYTLVASDAGKCITISAGGITVPNAVFSTGDAVTIVNHSGSDQTITQGSSFTLQNSADGTTGNRTLAGRGIATLWFPSSGEAYISGAGLS